MGIIEEYQEGRRDFSGADLRGAYLRNAYLMNTDLSGADLSDADLSGADFRRADLRGADLRFTNLRGANFSGADLRDAYLPSPGMLLLAQWGEVSDELTRDLMRLDASAHPGGIAVFDTWAKGGECPYNGCQTQRVANFQQKKHLWAPGPPPTLWEAVSRLLKEKTRGCVSERIGEE